MEINGKALTGLDRESAHPLQLPAMKRSCCTAANLGATGRLSPWVGMTTCYVLAWSYFTPQTSLGIQQSNSLLVSKALSALVLIKAGIEKSGKLVFNLNLVSWACLIPTPPPPQYPYSFKDLFLREQTMMSSIKAFKLQYYITESFCIIL